MRRSRTTTVHRSPQEKLQLFPPDFDQVPVLQRLKSFADSLAVDSRGLVPFDMGDEIALRPAHDHGGLQTGRTKGF